MLRFRVPSALALSVLAPLLALVLALACSVPASALALALLALVLSVPAPPPLSGPRPSLNPNLGMGEVQPTWDDQTVHLMRTSERVQAYFGAPNAATTGHKRTKEPQEGRAAGKRPRHSVSRRAEASPANVLPAILSRSQTLARRLPSLASRD